MSIAILLQQILIIFLEIGTGAAVTKLGIMDDRNSKFLSQPGHVGHPALHPAGQCQHRRRPRGRGRHAQGLCGAGNLLHPHHRHLPCAEQGHGT